MEKTLRKVLYKKWIPAIFSTPEEKRETGKSYKEGTFCYENEFTHPGLFHEWGVNYEEYSEGPGNFTVALVENPDGTIEQVDPKCLKFISK